MLEIVKTASFIGMEAIEVTCEVDSARGLPAFHVVGLGDTAVKEAGDRVRAAVINGGYDYPKGRVTVNLYPAWIRKKGSHFDLPIAMGILAITGAVRNEKLNGKAFIGELSLEGKLIPVRGILPMLKGLGDDIREVYVPEKNGEEAALCLRGTDKKVVAAAMLKDVVNSLNSASRSYYSLSDNNYMRSTGMDYSDVKGLWTAKDAIVTAVAGGHGLLMIGPPGSGKTMLAERIPTILPPLSPEEQLETSMIYSIRGGLDGSTPLIMERPFVRVTPGMTGVNILGGGNEPLPGEMSMAHNGVFFMDEFLEFDRRKIEALRKPLEEKRILMIRRGMSYSYPADVIFIAASNPCKCGYFGDPEKECRCTPYELEAYRSKLSGPLADRIDMSVSIQRVRFESLSEAASDDSKSMKEKVLRAIDMQEDRFRGTDIKRNAMMNEKQVREFCAINREERAFLEKIYRRYSLSPRRYYKLLKIARTAADVRGIREIDITSLNTAVSYTEFLNTYGKFGE